MKKLTIAKRTLVGFGFLCLLCAAIGWFAIWQELRLKTIADSIVSRSMPALTAMDQVQIGLAQNEIRMSQMSRLATAAERSAILDEARRTTMANEEAIQRYEASIVNPEERRDYEAFAQRRHEFQAVRTSYVAMLETNQAEAGKLLDGPMQTAFRAYMTAGGLLGQHNLDNAAAAGRAFNASVRNTIQVLVLATLLAAAFGLACSVGMTHSITRVLLRVTEALKDGSHQVTSAADQVASASQSLAEGASEQAASLEETSASLEEMSSMTKTQRGQRPQSQGAGRRARQAADTGAADMDAMRRP